MRRFLSLLLSLALAGCAMKSPYAIEPRVLSWTTAVTDRYDFAALSDFVNKTIQEPYDWQGLDLSKRDANQWGFRPGACMLVGDNWIFGSPDPKKDAFILITSFPKPNSKAMDVTLHCIRRARDAFEVESVEIEEHELSIGAPKGNSFRFEVRQFRRSAAGYPARNTVIAPNRPAPRTQVAETRGRRQNGVAKRGASLL